MRVHFVKVLACASTYPCTGTEVVDSLLHVYRPQMKFVKVMFFHRYLSVQGGVCLWSRGGVCHTHTPWADLPQADTPQADTHPRAYTPPWADTPSAQCMLGYIHPLPSACWVTVNKWVVRIPLECILVQRYFESVRFIPFL